MIWFCLPMEMPPQECALSQVQETGLAQGSRQGWDPQLEGPGVSQTHNPGRFVSGRALNAPCKSVWAEEGAESVSKPFPNPLLILALQRKW